MRVILKEAVGASRGSLTIRNLWRLALPPNVSCELNLMITASELSSNKQTTNRGGCRKGNDSELQSKYVTKFHLVELVRDTFEGGRLSKIHDLKKKCMTYSRRNVGSSMKDALVMQWLPGRSQL